MSLVVTPSQFDLVFFKHDEVVAACEAVRAMVPGAGDLGPTTIQVDETKPTNRVRIVSMDPIIFSVHSGAFENTARPRSFSESQTKICAGRLWFEALDRADDDFGAPAPDDDIPGEIRAAWDVYCFGRVAALGLRVHQPRYIYDFYNRVGFTDDATLAFNDLWNASRLSYAEIVASVADLVPTRAK